MFANSKLLCLMNDDVKSKSAFQEMSDQELGKTKNIKEKPKTLVEISVNGNLDNLNWIEIAKNSNSISLNDIKSFLKKSPKMFGMSNTIEYQYKVKISMGSKVGFKLIDKDDSILPLFGDQIELQCWSE